jgi:hypothetical protein
MLHPPYRRYDDIAPIDLLPLPHSPPTAKVNEKIRSDHIGWSSQYSALAGDTITPHHSLSTTSLIATRSSSSLGLGRTRKIRKPTRERVRLVQQGLSYKPRSTRKVRGGIRRETASRAQCNGGTCDPSPIVELGCYNRNTNASDKGRAVSASERPISETPQMPIDLTPGDDPTPKSLEQSLLTAGESETVCEGYV